MFSPDVKVHCYVLFSFQVAAAVGKYLWFLNPGTRQKDIWKNFGDVKKIDEWYDMMVAKSYSPSSVYNMLSSIIFAADFRYVKLNKNTCPRFLDHVKSLRDVQSRRRKIRDQDVVEREGSRGIPNMKPMVELLQKPETVDRFLDVFDKCTQILDGTSPDLVLRRDEYLFSMRVVLLYVICSMGLRPSSVYTIKTALIEGLGQVGQWPGSAPILFRNPERHKTTSVHGYSRIVVSGEGKRFLSMFVSGIRHVYAQQKKFESCDCLFMDTTGKGINASAVNRNLQAFLLEHELPAHFNATHIRKCITSQLKAQGGDSLQELIGNAVSAGLLHSANTSSRHYTVGQRDILAMELHRAIRDFYDL